MAQTRRQPSPTAKLLLAAGEGLAVYLAVFVVGPALADSTSQLRLKLAEARDSLARARFRIQEIRAFRSEINRYGKDGDPSEELA